MRIAEFRPAYISFSIEAQRFESARKIEYC
jgi:hypothetical protein